MSEEFYTELVITSHTLTPTDLNLILGIECDEGHVIGDLRKPTIIREKENAWTIYSRISRDNTLEKHIYDLLERVTPIIDKVGNLANRPDVEVFFTCVIYTSNRPTMFFTKEQVATIYAMGASIDIDLYFLPR
jgi:hypothetical protein